MEGVRTPHGMQKTVHPTWGLRLDRLGGQLVVRLKDGLILGCQFRRWVRWVRRHDRMDPRIEWYFLGGAGERVTSHPAPPKKSGDQELPERVLHRDLVQP